ncbi:MAG: WxcM-like domain-containing protein [Clostridia bacterium]|nr:WxcM-like domain-containing protein [Clostridia bacterium]
MEIKKFSFEIHGDKQGELVSLEEMKNIPFPIRRVYYIYRTEAGVVRGKHAHKSLEQVLICIHGSCRLKLDNGRGETEVLLLDRPNEGIYIANDMWREMFDFSPDAVLMVLASEYYDESDYIRNYQDFLNYVRKE